MNPFLVFLFGLCLANSMQPRSRGRRHRRHLNITVTTVQQQNTNSGATSPTKLASRTVQTAQGSTQVAAQSAQTSSQSAPAASQASQTSQSSKASQTASQASQSSQSSQPSSNSDDSAGISKDQLDQAVAAYALTGNGNPPKISDAIYQAYQKWVTPRMSLREQAMFLANAIWETGGLQYMEEIACKTGGCAYGKYFGRGFLQLTHDYNYKAASQALFNDNRLVDNPELAATPEGAWQTALWFWTSQVQPKLKETGAIDKNDLGVSVNVINGGLECGGGPNDKAQKRLKIYDGILKAFNLSGSGNLNGCKR